MMAIPALTFARVIVDNQGMLIIQVQCKHTKPHLSRESPHLYIKGIATSIEELLLYSEMCEASVAICKTKSALYRHVVTSGFVTVHTHGICCIIEEWHYIWYWPEFRRTTRPSYIRVYS